MRGTTTTNASHAGHIGHIPNKRTGISTVVYVYVCVWSVVRHDSNIHQATHPQTTHNTPVQVFTIFTAKNALGYVLSDDVDIDARRLLCMRCVVAVMSHRRYDDDAYKNILPFCCGSG